MKLTPLLYWLVAPLLVGACSQAANPAAPVTVDPAEAPAAPATGASPAPGSTAGAPSLPEPTCSDAPQVGAAGAWRHSVASPVVVALGSPNHRGLDLVSSAAATVQLIRGEISYGVQDKALEDEQVELFACRAGAWQPLGTATTNSEGAFLVELTGGDRLPVGLRALYLSVVGDRSGAGFVALVAPEGSALAVSDVDGTLTSSENAYPISLASGATVAANPGAPAALAMLRQRGFLPVYVTARGRVFTASTRAWLDGQGFPRGPTRLASSLFLLPGASTIDYKSSTLDELKSTGLKVGVGLGNRASDAQAYGHAGVPGDRVFLKQPEFADECAPEFAAGDARGFDSYVTIEPTFAMLTP